MYLFPNRYNRVYIKEERKVATDLLQSSLISKPYLFCTYEHFSSASFGDGSSFEMALLTDNYHSAVFCFRADPLRSSRICDSS